MNNIVMYINDTKGQKVNFDANIPLRYESIESVSFIINGKEYFVKEGQFFKSAGQDIKLISFDNFKEALGTGVNAELLEDGLLIIEGLGTKTIRIKAKGK